VRTQLPLTAENLPDYLKNRGLARPDEDVRVESAGEGNINWVRRAWLGNGGRSVIVKQARPALERFPEYQVTTERIVFEARYYATVEPFDAAHLCPRVLDFDEAERVLLLEDLGDAPQLDEALAATANSEDAGTIGEALGSFLGAVHAATAPQADLARHFQNDDMRRLHGDHIFALPFRENDFGLSAPLRARAEAVWRDDDAVALADAAYRDYLAPTGALVHGDVQGGNVLCTAGGPRLLDAEISHVGDAAFDIGILLAHLMLSDVTRGDAAPARPVVIRTWRAYVEHVGRAAAPPFARAARYAGIELVRRTIGAARVPAVADDAAGLRVLDLGLRWLAAPPEAP
jgi:5-methylthioribose kinase